MAKKKDPPLPPPPPHPDFPSRIKCAACSRNKTKDDPDVRWTQRHCKQPCAWYVCSCGGWMWIEWSPIIDAWVVRQVSRMK